MTTVTVDGIECYYRVSKRAPERGPAIVCLHGSGADSVVWSYQVSRLSRDWKVVAVDLPGHGRSGGRPLEAAGDYARWLERLCRALELDVLIVMGHSFGGAIAQEYARLYPAKLRALVLVGTGTAFRFSRMYRRLYEQGALAQAHDPDSGGGGGCPDLPLDFFKAYRFLKRNSSTALHADLLAAGGFDSTQWIGSIRVPALVVWGAQDVITPRELPQELARSLPAGRLQVVEEAGHVVMVDNANGFNDAVKGFAAEILRHTPAACASRCKGRGERQKQKAKTENRRQKTE